MKRRVDLAAALIHNPEVLFLDEPTTGLDPASRAKVWEEVQRLNHELGMTIFLTTQYLEEADALADRVGIIDHGRIIAEGTPAELKRSIGADVVTVRVDNVARRRLDDRGASRRRQRRGPRRRDPRRDRRWSGECLADRWSPSPGRISACARSPCASRRSTTSSSP